MTMALIGAGPAAPPAAGGGTGSILVTVINLNTMPQEQNNRNVTVNGVTQATNASGQTTFTNVTAGAGITVALSTGGESHQNWTSSQGTASGSGYNATGVTVTTGQTTNVNWTLDNSL